MLNLNDLRLFAAAVEHGGFAAASRALDLPKSTISKRVAELENDLQTRLIQRTSRSFKLTEVGQAFYEHARGALIEVEAAQDVIRKRWAEPSGVVRITASLPVAQHYLAPKLPGLVQTFPKLHVQLEACDRFVDIVQEGFDLAIRSHFAPLPDSGLVQRQLMVEPVIMVAAPVYLEQHKRPQSPEDLPEHDCLLTHSSATTWRLTNNSGNAMNVKLKPRMTANESSVLLSAAIAGLGIVCLPDTICRSALLAGTLTRVLPAWVAGNVTTTIIMPHRRGQLPSVRALVDFLVESVSADRSGQ